MPKGINYILPLLLSVVSWQLNAQNFNLSNHRTFANLLNKHVDTLENFHTSIRPFSKKELPQYDAIINSYPTKKASFIQNEHFVTNQKKTFLLDPVVNLGTTIEQKENTAKGLLERAIGFNIHYYLGEKWSSQVLFLSDHSSYPSHINSVVATKNNSPGYGYSTANHSYYSQANITFTPSNVFAFQLGYGKNFIGDGYRSLLLSDNANSYPYLKITATVWKLKYMALYTNYQDIGSANGRMNNYFHKFSATHYLSLNATKWWNIGLFESIIWQAQEGDFYRGYDIHYINPLMILRPTEYAQGSADNALIGSSMKFKIKKKNILYTQLVLDEFLLREMTARNGWWANKYGYQIGLKLYDVVGIKNATLQLEYNTVRPFTYSHSYTPTNVSTLQNYAHFNAPLAHPLGANFKEANMPNLVFDYANLSKANFKNANCYGCQFHDIKQEETNWSGTTLTFAHYTDELRLKAEEDARA